MTINDERWQLPSGMDEMLPAQALLRERLRRQIYDLHIGWGYQPVHPPMVEYIDSLLTAAGQDFDQQTFRLADPQSGRMLGVRADMTPQVARIDAHQMANDGISRLFYLGTVVRAQGDRPGGNRSPLQLGAELYGHRGSGSDVEVIQLMLATLAAVGIEQPYLDLGHVGVFRNFCSQLNLSATDEQQLFELLQAKAEADIESLAQSIGIDRQARQTLVTICGLHGDVSVLARAAELLDAERQPQIAAALVQLQTVGDALCRSHPVDRLHFDLAELRGYQYHNGVVYAAYVAGEGSEIARGGRYDDVGAAFGRARAATGYSTDLKALMRLSSDSAPDHPGNGILAPLDHNDQLHSCVARLRAAGEIVLYDLEGHGRHELCDRILNNRTGEWTVQTL